MSFIDPYHLLNIEADSPEAVTKSVVRKAKRRLLAEFELAEDIVIDFQGLKIDKSTALQAADKLEDPVLREHYWHLHRQQELLAFLSEGRLFRLRRIPPAAELGDEAFRKFLSKQVAPVVEPLLTQAFKARNRGDWSLLMDRLDLIDQWDLDTALKGALRILNENVLELDRSSDESGEYLRNYNRPDLYDMTLMEALNKLPVTYQHLRNRYADMLRWLAIRMNNRGKRCVEAFEIISAAHALETDHAVGSKVEHSYGQIRAAKDTVQKRQQAKQKNASASVAVPSKKVQPRDFDKRSNYVIVAAVIAFLLIIYFLVAPNAPLAQPTGHQDKNADSVYTKLNAPDVRDDAPLDSNARDLLSLEGNKSANSSRENRTAEIDRQHDARMKAIQARHDSTMAAIDARHDSTMAAIAERSKKRQTENMARIEKTRKDMARSMEEISHKDWAVYRALNGFAAGKFDPGAQPGRPANGESPYQSVLSPMQKGPLNHSSFVTVMNNSSKDLVVFVESLFGGEVLQHFYVRAGRKYTLNHLPAGFFNVVAYAGTHWQVGQVAVRGKRVGAFASTVDPLELFEAGSGKKEKRKVNIFIMGPSKDPNAKIDFGNKYVLSYENGRLNSTLKK